MGTDVKRTKVLVNFLPSIAGNEVIEIVRKVLGTPFTLTVSRLEPVTFESNWYFPVSFNSEQRKLPVVLGLALPT